MLSSLKIVGLLAQRPASTDITRGEEAMTLARIEQDVNKSIPCYEHVDIARLQTNRTSAMLRRYPKQLR